MSNDKTSSPDIPPLSTLYVYMTEGCNLACKHCWLAPKFDPDGTRHPVLDPELFASVIEEALPLGLRSVKLTGGEPLLHPQIHRILDTIENAGIRMWMESNGLLCDPSMAARLARFPDPFVSVSLDGATAAVHDGIRAIPGSFERSLRGIRNLVDAGVRVQVIFSLMRDNAHQYEAIIGLAESLGVGSIKYNLIQPTERGIALHRTDRALGIEEYVAIGRRVEEELAPASPVALFYDHPLAFRPLHRLADPDDHGGTCGIRQLLGLLPDGTWALCGIGTSVEGMAFGRAGRDPLARVWRETAALRAIRRELPAAFEGVCGRCLMKAQCLGACIAQNYYRTRDLRAPFWYCEAAEGAGLFPPSRLADSPPTVTR